MVVLWCSVCGALMGVKEPIQDWSTSKSGVCPACLKRLSHALPPDVKKELEKVPNAAESPRKGPPPKA
jgi:hypothetical protein